MATVQTPVNRPAPQPKQEGFVEAQIQRALRRIRMLDVVAGLCGLFVGIFFFGLAVMVLDGWLVVPSLIRQLAFAGFFLAVVAYLGFVVIRPLFRPLDSRYVAVRVEQTLPASKNSVINWVDLRERNLPGAIRGAVAGRAAKDLSQADIDRAISARKVFWLGGVAAALLVGVIAVLCHIGPAQFF